MGSRGGGDSDDLSGKEDGGEQELAMLCSLHKRLRTGVLFFLTRLTR